MYITPYTGESFRRFADYAQKHGQFDPTCGNDEIAKLYKKISSLNHKIKTQPTNESPEVSKRKEERHELYVQLEEAKRRYFHEQARDVAQKLKENRFSWGLKKGPVVSGKQTYRIGDEGLLWFSSREVMRELRLRTNPLRGRDYIISGLKQTLDKKFEHHLYRTDICSFFENVSHEYLLKKLESESGISQITLQLIRKLLSEYAALTDDKTDTKRGIPRGVSISSQLSELYLRDVDNAITYSSNVLYYARFVDDIVIVTATSGAMNQAKDRLEGDIESLGLELAPSDSAKCADIDIYCDSKTGAVHTNSFTFLGYKFKRAKDDDNSPFTQVCMSEAKIDRLKNRMQASFKAWQRKTTEGKACNGGADSLLLQRIRFLTGNTRISGKKNVLVGIYFSNSNLSDEGVGELEKLDEELKSLIESYIHESNKLRDRLNECSFISGYRTREYIRFTPNKLNLISQIWKWRDENANQQQ